MRRLRSEASCASTVGLAKGVLATLADDLEFTWVIVGTPLAPQGRGRTHGELQLLKIQGASPKNDMTETEHLRATPHQHTPDTREDAQDARRAAFEINKLGKRLHRLVGRAIVDYLMIEAGDKVMVWVWGG